MYKDVFIQRHVDRRYHWHVYVSLYSRSPLPSLFAAQWQTLCQARLPYSSLLSESRKLKILLVVHQTFCAPKHPAVKRQTAKRCARKRPIPKRFTPKRSAPERPTQKRSTPNRATPRHFTQMWCTETSALKIPAH